MNKTVEPGVTVVIPAFNEEQGLESTVETIRTTLSTQPRPFEVVVVDDGSEDGTAGVANRLEGIRLVRNEYNMGYGAALKRGIRSARYDTIVITDADGTYPNDRIPDLLAAMDNGVTMVVGYRKGKVGHGPFVRRAAKWVIRQFASILVRDPIPDINSGLRVFPRSLAVNNDRLLPSGFSFTTTITLLVVSGGGYIEYVPIEYFPRHGVSKFHPIRDVANMIGLIVRSTLLFNPLRIFTPIAFGFFSAAATILALALFGVFERIPDATIVILLVTGVQVLFMGLLADLINRRLS